MKRLLVGVMAAALSACASERLVVSAGQIALPEPVVGAAESDTTRVGLPGDSVNRPLIERLTMPERAVETPSRPDVSVRFPADNQVTVAAAGIPMRDFLNYVFGDLLKVNFIVAEGVAGLDNPVTLNTQQPVSSRQLYRLSADLISQNGLSVTERDSVFFVGPADGKAGGDIPIGYGAKPSDVPEVGGRILQVIPLRYGYNIAIERTVRELVDVAITLDPQQSALFVTGSRGAILKVLDVVKLLDQPSVRSSRVGILNLTYIGSKEFVEQMTLLLENEGIPAGVGRADGKVVALVPLDQLGAVAVFATSAEILDRVEFWTKQIDRPSQGPSQRYFIYQPRNARASDLGESLAPLIGTIISGQTGNQSRDTRSAVTATPGISAANALRRDGASRPAGEGAVSVTGDGVTMSVDPRSNSLVFFTTGLRYEALLPLIRRLDVPPKQILLEATIAEVSLTGEFANGVEFAFKDKQLSGGTLGRLGLPTSGLALNWIENITDEVRLRLQASDSRVNVLSKPILVVRDGVPASISVGNDVPTVGATASDPIESNRTITTVLYRKTGLSLTIVPTINAQGLVVMEINQTISNTVPGSSGVSGAPTFFDRSVVTEVVARSGQSVLLAGLISETGSDTSDGIPWVRKLPVLGAAFRSDSRKREKTELVLLITPRVIETPEEWDSVRSGLESALQYLQPAAPSKSSASSPAAPAPLQE
jgi:general secretion pathway protein D